MVDIVVEAVQEFIELVFGSLCNIFCIFAAVVLICRIAMQDGLVALGIILLSSIGVAEDLKSLIYILKLLGPLRVLIRMISQSKLPICMSDGLRAGLTVDAELLVERIIR